MNSKQPFSINSSVKDLLNPILGDRTDKAVNRLKKYWIETTGQLLGAIRQYIPVISKKEAEKKGIETSFLRLLQNRPPAVVAYRLCNVLGVSTTDALKIFSFCEKISSRDKQYFLRPGWAFGAIRQNQQIISNYWNERKDIRVADGFYIIPNYHRAGPVFDQCERSTSVANAFCALLNYKTGEKWSRQFFHFQCKMMDKIPSREGTSIDAAMFVLERGSHPDSGNIEESIWPYNPSTGRTVHQGPPPEEAYKTRRLFAAKKPVFLSSENRVNHIQLLLNDNINGTANPVVIGIPVFESGLSFNTANTGWMTMPLPGETIVGYHAMLIVGYDKERGIFLARNSWGSNWAYNNDRGYSGHAWIPFDYIQRYCFVAATVPNLDVRYRNVPEGKRLFHNKNQEKRYNCHLVALVRPKTPTTKRKKSYFSFPGLVIRIIILILLLYLYKKPFDHVKKRVHEVISERVTSFKMNRNVADFWNNLTK